MQIENIVLLCNFVNVNYIDYQCSIIKKPIFFLVNVFLFIEISGSKDCTVKNRTFSLRKPNHNKLLI